MQGPATETVGDRFDADLLRSARDKTLMIIQAAALRMKAGISESEAKKIIQTIQTEMGAEKSWHPSQIRFGINSTLVFGERGEEQILRADDIYFFDIGPIFDGHEGDVGRPFVLGKDPEHARCCLDAEAIWHEVRDHWRSSRATGVALYDFARSRAQERGWELLLDKANGHRIADFPHAARARGSIEGFEATPAPDRWILEIQIRHPERPFGAFFEDLLN
jgi:Xaa-Pro aminopeptidase